MNTDVVESTKAWFPQIVEVSFCRSGLIPADFTADLIDKRYFTTYYICFYIHFLSCLYSREYNYAIVILTSSKSKCPAKRCTFSMLLENKFRRNQLIQNQPATEELQPESSTVEPLDSLLSKQLSNVLLKSNNIFIVTIKTIYYQMQYKLSKKFFQ